MFGVHSPGIVAWARGSMIGRLLELAYNTMLLQTAAVVALLGFTQKREALEKFTLRMMLGGIVVLAFFLVLPAEGPFNDPSASQAHYLEHLRTLRSGAMMRLDLSNVDGLITFPSFHTIWALLLIVACPRLPIIALNAAVIAATVTTGWHYVTDVAAGAVVCVLICLLKPGESQ